MHQYGSAGPHATAPASNPRRLGLTLRRILRRGIPLRLPSHSYAMKKASGVRDLEVPGLWFLFFVAFVLAPRYAK